MNEPDFIVTRQMITILADMIVDRSRRNGSGKQRYSLEEDARQLNISVPYLQAIFRELFADPPKNFVMHVKRFKVKGVGEWIRYEF